MTDTKLKDLLNNLQDALEQRDSVDSETLELVHELDEEIHRLTKSGAQADDLEGVTDQARAMQSRFAVEHPVADRFLREIIDALSRVGI